MPAYDVEKIISELLPTYVRQVTTEENRQRKPIDKLCYVQAANGEAITRLLPFPIAAYFQEAISAYAFDKEYREGKGVASKVVAHVRVDGLAILKGKQLEIFRDRMDNPYIGLSSKYRSMIKSYMKKVMATFEGVRADLPIKGKINVQAIFYCGRTTQMPRMTDLIDTAVDLLVACGIIVSDTQVVSLHGSRIERDTKNKTGADVIVRSFES